MPISKDQDDRNKFRTNQLLLVVYSIVFLAVLFNGWTHLFPKSMFLGAIAAGVLSLLAWLLGKVIGQEGGVSAKNTLLFSMLLIISAAGVFNSMMLNLEGKKIFSEAIDSSQDRFRDLKMGARDSVRNSDLEAKHRSVEGARDNLLREIRNKLNCGIGPVAKNRLVELKVYLPNLKLPDPGRQPPSEEVCNQRADDAEEAINQETDALADTKSFRTIENDAATVKAAADVAENELENVRRSINDGSKGTDYLLGDGREKLYGLELNYKKNLDILRSYAKDTSLPSRLDLDAVRSLGEWSQIINIIKERLDRSATYVYLLLSVFLDGMLCYLFARYYSTPRPGTRISRATPASVQEL
jgi:hypothetical protein